MDPLMLKIALINNNELKKDTGQTLSQILQNPQSLNTYAYTINNPIRYIDPDGQNWQTYGQGLAGAFVYAYHNPLQTLGVLAVGTAAVIAAPVATAVVGAALGGIAVGAAVGNAINASDADTRDYYLGQGTTAAALTVLGMKGASSLNNSATVSNGFQLGQEVDGFGKVVENTSGKITGFIRPNAAKPFHGLDRAVGRDVTTADILNTVKNPLITFQQANGNIYRLTQEAAVVLDQVGKVVTTYGKSDFYPKVINLLQTLTK